ncbi:MAG TPA: SRPBCC family protein [Vicinamibacterales bacterium]|nr:SRPBCC family protein [Vicinamibacterales bacterium]
MILRTALYLLAALVATGIVVTAIGYVLPRDHVASTSAVIAAPPDAVFARISDPPGYPAWRREVDAVEVVSRDPLRWVERAGGDALTYEVAESTPARRFVTRIADPDLPFGGTWTYDLAPEGDGTRVTITERGEVYNPVFRFMSRFVLSRTKSMEQVLRQLQP